SYTLAGPPEKMRPRGLNSATRAAVKSCRTSCPKTFCSRTRRAISWPYCAPKSKINTRSLSSNCVISIYAPGTEGFSSYAFPNSARPPGRRLDRVHERGPHPAAFQSVQSGDGRAAGTGDSVFQHGRMQPGVEHHLGGPENRLRGQRRRHVARQSDPHAAVAE